VQDVAEDGDVQSSRVRPVADRQRIEERLVVFVRAGAD